MNMNSTAELSSLLSAQKFTSDLNVAAVKLANERIEAQGAAALALIQAIPQNDSPAGSYVDVRA
jgi:hypothetical protein